MSIRKVNAEVQKLDFIMIVATSLFVVFSSFAVKTIFKLETGDNPACNYKYVPNPNYNNPIVEYSKVFEDRTIRVCEWKGIPYKSISKGINLDFETILYLCLLTLMCGVFAMIMIKCKDRRDFLVSSN